MKSSSMTRSCSSYVAANMFTDSHRGSSTKRLPAITISRQTGSRGSVICQKLLQTLQENISPDMPDWHLYDQDLVKHILREHNLPEDLERFMPDSSVNEYTSTINELLGRHPSLWSLYEDSVETIQRLARQGHCIIVGRGGNHVTRSMGNVLRICISGSRNHRMRYLTNREHLTTKQIDAIMKNEDGKRKSYVRQHYNADADDPSDYDLMINTDHLSDETVVEILVHALKKLQ